MKLLYLLIIFTSFHSQAWEQTDISLNSDGHVINGSLAHPKSSDTVVLMIAGSGPTDRDGNQSQMKSNAYLMVAKALYENGYATVRYDKRGIGASAKPKVNMNELRFEHYANDASLWVEKLSKQYKKVILLGHSIGGLMALQVAQEKPVTAVITLAGMASSGYDTLKRQLSNQSEFVKNTALPLLERLAKNENIPESEVPAFLMSLFHPNLQGFVKSFLHIEPKEEISKVKQPILVVIGDTDIQITVDETSNMQQGSAHAELVTIKGMNHVLKPAPLEMMANMATYQDPNLKLHKDLMPHLLAFLSKF